MRICRSYTFESAHRLPHVPEGHKCGRLHGHSYRLELVLVGPLDAGGMVLDFAAVDAVAAPLVERLDHHYLNEVEGLENPTSENLCRWVWERLRARLPQLAAVRVSETGRSWAEWDGGAL